MKPRIGFGVDPNSDTTSTNMIQQLLLENQKYNDDKTNQKFFDYHKQIENGMKEFNCISVLVCFEIWRMMGLDEYLELKTSMISPIFTKSRC
jgi:hypothetical protein